MANKNVELKTNLFEEEELSDADLIAVVGGAGFIQNAEQGADSLANGTINDGVGSPAFINGSEKGANSLANGTLATQYGIVSATAQQLGTAG